MAAPRPERRPLQLARDGWSVEILDQTLLPHACRVRRLRTLEDAAVAIETMQVRGAPLIGVTAAYGVALALRESPGRRRLNEAYDRLIRTRPTAVNLRWALDDMRSRLAPLTDSRRLAAAYARAAAMVEEDIATNRALGEHGLRLFRQALARKGSGQPLQVMTHCNAGRLATLEWGTATAPIYLAHAAGLPVHVWVSETRPRNQGAALTAWELTQRGIPVTVIADNAAGHLLQRGQVDLVIVGADRVTSRGDAANKVGTYLKALAARAHRVPFYVAFPGTTIDWTLEDGVAGIPIEERSAREVTHVTGPDSRGVRREIRLTPPDVAAGNPAFDVTPARWITALITERGVCRASSAGLRRLYPEHASPAR